MSKQKQDRVSYIAESHQRCEAYSLEKGRQRPKLFVDEKPLKDLLEHYKDFTEIASPILMDMANLIGNEEFILLLCDKEACILQLFGQDKALKEVAKKGIQQGVFLNELSAGTNAVSLALRYCMPIQVRAEEHYFKMFHTWSASASPILISGHVEACVCAIGNVENGHLHALALVSAIAKSIENTIENTEVQKQLFDSNMYAFAMMNSLSYGVFAIDMNDTIHWVNDTACRKINIRRLHLLEKPIKELYPDWSKAKKTIIEQMSFDDVEGQFSISGLKDRFLFNAIPIKTKENDILGFILMFRELSRMIKALNKYTGMEAQFVFDDIITQDAKMQAVIKNAKIIAKSPTTLLITGESGTGKEVFAQAIHNASDRADGPFVALNCGAISPTLIESELFGYEEGAFTGAKKGGKPGKFELANGGTLFLDEIGEMSLDMQVKLLRSLQEGNVLRVGANKTLKLDVRVIAATHKNLSKEVQEGRFRLDLFYRLDVIQLKIPSLRERKSDIIPLLNYFLRQKAEKLKMNVPDLHNELIKRLCSYAFPGNVRELENFAEKAVLFGGKLSLDMLDEEVRYLFAEDDDLWMDDRPTTQQFPDYLHNGQLRLAASYRFDPSHDEDGAT
ncbi:MAG: sigma 54-interacting transcriptional regulator, partial [Bacteroidales bacterium]